ncbi:hypothetical protein ACFVH7_39240 [Kitasatospora indigofera]|uniref:WXG100-like domain-containing protein n=1 Tax=Kitasatospora indigofera TaxID=67307 RepID=UPI003635F009
MIELPSDLAEVLKVVQSNEHGSSIVFPNANEELLAELAAAWEAWNTAAEPAVRTIVASANRAMANMSGTAADSFEAYLRKYAGTDQSHAVTTLDAGVAMAQSLRGAEQAVTQTKGEMVRELRYAKEYMDQNPAGKHDDIAQSEGIKTAADTYNRYVGQVGTSVDSMLRESAGHIERMTGAGQVATLGGHGGGATAPTRGTPAGAMFDPSTLQRPDGVDLASYPGAVPPGGSAAEFSPFSAMDGTPGGMPGTLPDGMGGGVGGSGGSSYRPQLASFKPFEPPAPGGPGGASSGGIGMGGADLPVYRPNPASLSLAGLSGAQSSFDPTGGIGGALSPWSGGGRGAGGTGPSLSGGAFGGAFGGASPFGGLGLPGGLGSGAARPSSSGSRFTPGSTTAASAGRGVTGTTGRSLAGGMPGAGGAGRGSAGGGAGGFGGGRGVGSGSVAGARAGGARSGLGVAGSGEGSTRSGLGAGTGSGRGGAGGAAGAGTGTGRTGASAAGAGGAHAGGHPGGGAGRKGKGEGDRFVRPSRFGEYGPEDEEGTVTDSGVQGQAVRHEQGDRRMEQMRRRWLDAARSDDQGAPQGTGAQGAGAQGPGRPGPDGAAGTDPAGSEQALLTQLASAVLGTGAPSPDAPDTGTAVPDPAGAHLASAAPAAATPDTPATPAAAHGPADAAATGDDAYLDRARAVAARRGRPDEDAPAARAQAAGAPASATSAAEAGRPAPLWEEGGFQVPSPFLRAALSRLATTGALEGTDGARPAPAAGR